VILKLLLTGGAPHRYHANKNKLHKINFFASYVKEYGAKTRK